MYKKAIIEFHMFLQWHELAVFIPQNSCICHHLRSYQSSLVFWSGYASPQLCPSEENEEETDEGWRTVFWIFDSGPNYKGTKLSKKIAFFPVSWGSKAHSLWLIFLICFQESVQLVLFEICFPSQKCQFLRFINLVDNFI